MPEPMYFITKEFSFSASHQLRGLPADHPCSRLHGHNYKVKVLLTSFHLDENGFVRDYRELDAFKSVLDRLCDHRHLNDVFPDVNPTAENLAKKFMEMVRGMGFHECLEVAVSETDKTWAVYRNGHTRPTLSDIAYEKEKEKSKNPLHNIQTA